MGYLFALFVLIAWPISGVAAQDLAKQRGRDPDLWLFLCALGGPLLYLLLWRLPYSSEKIPRRRLVDRIIAIVAVLFVLVLLSSTMFRACLGRWS